MHQFQANDILLVSEISRLGRNFISQRTKEALQIKKRQGKTLGKLKASFSKETKLDGKEDIILNLLAKKVPVATIGRILGVHRLTVDKVIKTIL